MTDIRQNYVQFNRVCFSAGGVLRGNQCVCSQIEKFGKQERVPYGPSTYMFTWKNVFILFGLFKWKTETAALIKIFVTCKSICEGAIMELLPENITQNKAILCSIFSHVSIFSSKLRGWAIRFRLIYFHNNYTYLQAFILKQENTKRIMVE